MHHNLSIALIRKAHIIGATPYKIYSNEITHLVVPCKVMTQDRAIIDKSMISFQKTPPIESWQMHVRSASDVLDIMPSEYALPHRIRLATTKAKEIRMAFSPTPIKAKFWQRFNLNSMANFFDYREIKGKDIKKSWFFSMTNSTFSDDVDKITFFIAELNDDVMKELFSN